jgi:GDP-mannose 6-dehydrogenase
VKVSVFGLGHAGCVTSAGLARAGHDVTGVDECQNVVDRLNAGHAPVIEPGLNELLAEVIGEKRLHATTDLRAAVAATDIALICVGTQGAADGRPDVSAIARVAREICDALAGQSRTFTVLLRSTVLPGTTESVLVPALHQSGCGRRIKVGINPAFLREGFGLLDFTRPPLVLVGCSDLATASLVRDLYRDVAAPFVETSVRTAELVTYASAAFQGLKVCFANEIGGLSDALGADGREVMRIFSMDHRLNLSDAYLKPGFAFGGASLPRDVQALLRAAQDVNVDVPLLSAIAPSNESQIRAAVKAVVDSGKHRVGVVGFPCKSSAGSLAVNPVASLIARLVESGRDVRVFDRALSQARPTAPDHASIDRELPLIARLLCDDLESLLDHVEVLVVGRATRDAAQAVALIGPDCTLIDLTRGVVFDVQRDDDVESASAPYTLRPLA